MKQTARPGFTLSPDLKLEIKLLEKSLETSTRGSRVGDWPESPEAALKELNPLGAELASLPEAPTRPPGSPWGWGRCFRPAGLVGLRRGASEHLGGRGRGASRACSPLRPALGPLIPSWLYGQPPPLCPPPTPGLVSQQRSSTEACQGSWG